MGQVQVRPALRRLSLGCVCWTRRRLGTSGIDGRPSLTAGPGNLAGSALAVAVSQGAGSALLGLGTGSNLVVGSGGSVGSAGDFVGAGSGNAGLTAAGLSGLASSGSAAGGSGLASGGQSAGPMSAVACASSLVGGPSAGGILALDAQRLARCLWWLAR